MKLAIFENKLVTWTTIILSVAAIVGGAIAYDKSKADTSEVENLAMRLDLKIIKDRMEALQERIWMLQDRYKDQSTCPPEVKKEIRELQKELDDLNLKYGKKIQQQGG